MKKIVLFALAIFIAMGAMAQSDNVIIFNLDDNTHGSNYQSGEDVMGIFDDGGESHTYSGGHDYWVTITSTCTTNDTTADSIINKRYLCLTVDWYDIGCNDTLFIYDGPTSSSPVLAKINNCIPQTAAKYYVSPSNPTGEMTIRFRSTVRDTALQPYRGFHVILECKKVCENLVSVIDSVFDRIDQITGRVIGQGTLTWVPDYIDTVFYMEIDSSEVTRTDTIWDADSVNFTPHDTTFIAYDTTIFDSIISIDTFGMIHAALLCAGQDVRFHGHGEYNHTTGHYFPTDTNVRFEWKLQNDDYSGIGATSVISNQFQTPGCYDITLTIIDQHKCTSNAERIQARVSPNPIKTIFDLSEICNTDSLMVNVGYEGQNGTLTLRKIEFVTEKSKFNIVRNFIPDGPRCPGEDKCFRTPVDFTGEFPSGQKVRSAAEICSICINYEHSFMGDYRVAIECPTYDDNASLYNGYAFLKYGMYGSCPMCDPLAPEDSPDGNGAGGGTYTGWAYDFDRSPECDSLYNPYGIGLDYCWSRNSKYTLITGDLADVPTYFQPGQWYISKSTATIADNITFPQMPSYFTWRPESRTVSINTRQPSNHEEKYDYYSPSDDFHNLVGCPLNGVWNAVICDFYGIDNGWVFGWSLDICGLAGGSGSCDYQVGIDSVIWRPDTNKATDFYNGIYRGLRINKKSNDTTAAFISSPDTSGSFQIVLSVYDNFGCRWDTVTKIKTVHTPRPNLGNDTILCGAESIELNAGDKFSDRFNYRYTWEPYGDTSQSIDTHTGEYGQKTYVVEVNNSGEHISCPARDTIVLSVNPQPVPTFDPGVFPLEGCEPFTINIVNTTNYGHKYHWVFGDGTYSTLKNPSHSYAAGTYDFKYYVESDKGCKDSLIYTDLITVFPSPKAQFSWDPVYPTVLHPSVSLINNTAPDDGHNKYFWEIQYDKDNPYSFHTATENNTSFEWTASDGEDVSGNYIVRLIARYENFAPSGRLLQCADTIENTILLINDDILFPNVVTPNGDGINDRFVIGNLVEGLAYPINQLDIYDKWGSRVFHAVNIQREDQFWDPAKTNTPAGTYFYRFSGKGYKGNFEHNGVIEVLK